MNICFVGSLTSIHTKRWMRYFVECGHDVHVITPSGGADHQMCVDGLHVHPFRNFRTPRRAFTAVIAGVVLLGRVLQFRRIMKSVRPDLVHVHYINDAALFTLLAGFKPLVLTAWGSDILVAPVESPLLKYVIRFILRRADLVTCDAEHMKRALINLGTEPSKVAVIYFGTDVQKFHPRWRDPQVKKELDLGESVTVISLRRFEPLYDVETLINAAPLVLKKVPSVNFLLVGSGSEETRLKQIAKSLGIWDHVLFTGELSEEQMPRYLGAADIYVSTALSDGGLAASTAEAMACGLPVIITDVGDNREWVDNGVNGFLVPPQNPDALAARLIELAESQSLGERLGSRGRQVIEERNNWETEMAKVAERYEALLVKYTGSSLRK